MSREIKFRALTCANNVMVFGNLINYNPNLNPRIIWFENIGEAPHEMDFLETNNEVQPSTVGQFTGLKDKNGVEIYEGDICKVTYYNHSSPNTVIIQEITFGNGTFELKSKNNMDMQLEDSRQYVPLFYVYTPNTVEIIGNIHQNPELLK